MKNFIVGALIFGFAIIVGYFIGATNIPIGGASGTEHTNLEFFYAGLVQGGIVTTKTGATSTTLTAADVCNSGTIIYAAAVVAASTTFPTAASLTSNCLMNNGDTKSIIFRNTGTTATATITFVANTGNTLFIPEATGADLTIEGLNRAIMTFQRVSSTAVSVFVQEMLVQ
jgi:hypothetical protein